MIGLTQENKANYTRNGEHRGWGSPAQHLLVVQHNWKSCQHIICSIPPTSGLRIAKMTAREALMAVYGKEAIYYYHIPPYPDLFRMLVNSLPQVGLKTRCQTEQTRSS